MEIKEMDLAVRDLVEGYSEDDATSKVVAWGGKLDVRPEYQREYVYNDEQRSLVINTVMNGFPLNIMYFVDRKDGTYEVLDGQQRIISICQYYSNSAISARIPDAKGGYNDVNYPNLFDALKEKFLNYKLKVFVCEGTDEEKQKWFETINIAGVALEKQEIRNALYHSAWLTDAKSAFSRRNCVAHKNYGKYMNGEYIRQKYLETVLLWAADAEGVTGKGDIVSKYMQLHSGDANADALWAYFEHIFDWVSNTFGGYDKSMKGVKWGLLYNQHKDDQLAPKEVRKQVDELLADPEVQAKSNIYEYILTGEKKLLNLRQFDTETRLLKYKEQLGKCAICGKPFEIEKMHADHITPWSKGGKTVPENCQMLCRDCNLKKGAQE